MRAGAIASRRIAMSISRRNLLRHIGAGSVVGAAASALHAFPLPPATEKSWKNSVSAAQPSGAATPTNPVLPYRNENPCGASEKVLAVLRESAATAIVIHARNTTLSSASSPRCTSLSANKSSLAAAPFITSCWFSLALRSLRQVLIKVDNGLLSRMSWVRVPPGARHFILFSTTCARSDHLLF